MTQSDGLSRRAFLAASAAAAAAACSGDGAVVAPPTLTSEPTATTEPPTPTATPEPTATTAAPSPTATPEPIEVPPSPETTIASDPFSLGVASGDPTPDSIILWTRLVAAPGATPIPEGEHQVRWEIATSDSFSDVAGAGIVVTDTERGAAIHVDATGLEPDTWYAYRFSIGDWTSPTGRTRTLPPLDSSPRRVRLGFSSCQHIQVGWYPAHRHLARSGLDAFIWLGDYIYERDARSAVIAPSRRHEGGEATTLEGYRARYELYKRDPDLQAHHAAHPWIVTWDDHEVDGNHAGATSQNSDPVEEFLRRRAAAYQAWYEHMPVRVAPPDGPDMPIHRDFRWGDLAHLFALDTRQYRDPPPTDGEFIPIGGARDPLLPLRTLSPDALDPARTVLGTDQERWLLDGVTGTPARWKVLAQSVVMQGFIALPGSDPPLVTVDGWDGYSGNRKRLLEEIATAGVEDIVVFAGDVHLSIAGDVRTDPFDLTSPVVATEFVSSSISSTLGRITTASSPTALEGNPQMAHLDTRRGFVICELDAQQATGIFMAVDALDPDSDATEIARLRTTTGRPGLV